MHRYLLTLLLVLLCMANGFNLLNAQSNNNESQLFWQDVREADFTAQGTRYIIPNKYRALRLNVEAMRNFLAAAPMEQSSIALKGLVLALPMPDGSFARFRIVESPIMEAPLAAQFPNIKTYAGQGIDDPTATIRFDLTPQGFHALVLSSVSGSVFIDPYALGDINYYISYYKRDFKATDKNFDCGVAYDAQNATHLPKNLIPNTTNPNNDGHGELQQMMSTDGKKRAYRLALAATAEYTSFHGGATNALAAMNTSINRINSVYERDLAVRLNLISNTNLLIYTNAGSDPYTNNDGSVMLSQNQTNVNSVIGSANYDIGHVFSTGGGGIAQLGCVCTNSKAQGVTGSSSPVGDPFDIDYVAHEMGHQFGADHTFNTEDGSCCCGNRNASTAYEVGSGSTIMAYAGICSPSDVQNNSDDYFHAGSLAEILPFIVSGSGNNCPTKTNITHTAPTVSAGTDYTIPKSTPFMLTGSATDDDTGLTYCWEEMDLGTAASLTTTLSGTMPAFRSYDPTTSPTRVFPRMATVMAGTTDNREKIPNYARNMNFRLTVRDNHASEGRVGNDNMVVTVNGTAGPFLVTAPNTAGVSVSALSSYTVTWDVAGTTASPVSCANVDIYLIINNGSTYPQTLILANTPNDGNQVITIPNTPTTQARIMVKCSNNIFFDVSNSNFTITAATIPDFSMNATPPSQNICAPANATYTITTTQIAGLTTAINFTTSGLPAGTTATFSPSSVTPGNNTTLIISNTGAAASGNYTVIVTGTAGTITHTASVGLNITSGQVGASSLTAPLNAAAGVSVTPTFTWTAAANVSAYEIQVATDAAFANIVSTSTTLTTPTYTPATALNGGTTYFWRVRPINGCGSGSFTPTFVFATAGNSCTTLASTDVPKTISATGTPTVNSTLAVSGLSTITDVDVLNLVGTHTYMGDLRFRLLSPTGTNIVLYNFNTGGCQDEANFNVNFDDDVAAGNPPCTTTGGTYRSTSSALTTLDGQTPNGTWTLRVEDLATQDGGSLTSWSLRLCQAGGGALSGGTTATLKVFLEGALSGTTMTTLLKTNNLLPLSQPYSAAPFSYAGGEGVQAASSFPTNMTDWVLVEIWNSAATAIIERRAGWLLSDGSIVEPGSTSGLKFFSLQNSQSYNVIIRHRNHIAVMSSSPITVTSNAFSYDFTTGINKAMGSNQMKLVGTVAALFAADYNANGIINYTDYNVYKNAVSNQYTAGDGNLDKTIDANDFNLYKNNAGKIGILLIRY